MRRRVLAASLLAFALSGCEPRPILASIEVKQLTTPPLGVEISATRITLPEGIAVAMTIVGRDTKGELMDLKTPFEQSVVFQEAREDGVFILYGQPVGTFTVTMSPVDGDGSAEIEVEVVPQPPLP